jgi:hypothetical protein
VVAVAAFCLNAQAAWGDLLLYRCGDDVCRVAPDGTGKRRLASSGTHTWLSASADGPPFPLTVCLLAVNTDFPCERDVARDPAQDVFNPAFSPDGTLVAVVQAPGENVSAGPMLYDAATAAPVRVLTGGPDAQPSWSPDGRRIAFERDGDLYVARATGPPRERRILRGGRQPVWTTAPACRFRPRLRTRGPKVIVTACAPQPGGLTVTLRRAGRRVARRSVRAATGGTIIVRLRRPPGSGQLAATVR